MQRFVDDDHGYLRWLASNPRGFVLNAERQPRPAYLMLHRATCRDISGVPARGKVWTGDYIKLCGDRPEIETYARVAVGGTVRPCQHCITP